MKKTLLIFVITFVSFLVSSNISAYDECSGVNPQVPCSKGGNDYYQAVGNYAPNANIHFFNIGTCNFYYYAVNEESYPGLISTWLLCSSFDAVQYYNGSWNYGCSGGDIYHNYGDPNVTGYFELGIPSFTLTVTRSPEAGGGVASLDQEIECGYNSNNYCQADFTLNTNVELTAYPNTGYAFAYWEWNGGANSSTNNPETFTIDEALEVVAVFKPLFTFPLYGYSPTTVPISAVMDHSVFDHTPVQFYQTDDIVKAFNGEIGDKDFDYLFISGVWGYTMNEEEDTFLSGYNYTEGRYLFYDGHAGFDFAVSTGTDVLAPFSGKLYWSTTDLVNGNPGTYGTFYIDHENGYTTWFLHCSGLTSAIATEVQQNGFAQVTRGDHIAESGKTGTTGYHLHFEVRKGGVDDENVVDPYKEELWE